MSRRRACAIYTRKSTEEGLDQAFNSLQAQREACRAYVMSQAGEGWMALETAYDDGGVSGATMERPALQRLLADVAIGRIDVVVVYKVDRLTRSLSDFARIVEAFDARGVSFVSVTQAFNTTTSMGRLTLNVLLSFAQFEREVTGERIRDKIAASKRKGMWMGGVVPLGYDLRDRRLVVNEAEAATVRAVFALYLEHGNTRLVKEQADRLGLRGKARRRDGKAAGGAPLQRGHINKLLTSPIYIGEIVHKGLRHAGRHDAIVDRAVWEAVQARLKSNAVRRRRQENARAPSLLAGLVFDAAGQRLSPTHASKTGRRYRYYTSRAGDPPWRLPAPALEQAVLEGLHRFLNDRRRLAGELGGPAIAARHLQAALRRAATLGEALLGAAPVEQRAMLLDLIARIEVAPKHLRIAIRAHALRARSGLDANAADDGEASPEIVLDLAVAFARRGVEARLVIPGAGARSPAPDPKLATLLARARQWFAELRRDCDGSVLDLARRHGVDPGDVSRVLPLALLAPDIVEAILDGRQPPGLTAARLKRVRDLPLSWVRQRRMLGFP